ncbi:hypothetical protein Nepgr_016930 [Nepenthes gracilis]|uniref:Uncharacterized protein n=1 Tax=Nepenthes gracilis TaxID=150966 RepID=A0AAD3XSL8_NEPGR|nr:hypothetical protein Nepgr_016930 [Nepenthes gracilis]
MSAYLLLPTLSLAFAHHAVPTIASQNSRVPSPRRCGCSSFRFFFYLFHPVVETKDFVAARGKCLFVSNMQLAKLDDSPMFRQQIQCLEEGADSLRERCQKFYKGCRKYTEGLGEAYDGDIAFASALESFGGGHNDPISVAFGGPVMTKFTIALREMEHIRKFFDLRLSTC